MHTTEVVDIPYGTHWRFRRHVGSVNVTVTPDHEVELVASFLPDPDSPSPESVPSTGLDIRMGELAATGLMLRLRETFQTMGWPLPDEGECQI